MPEEVVYTQADQDAMFEALQFFDPAREGLTMDKLRPKYKQATWTEIRGTLLALVAAGRAQHKMRRPPGAATQYEYFTWVQA